jgi:hypothetical protein
MIWYEERLVRALQETRLADRREGTPRRRRGSASTVAVGVALRPAPVR